MRPVAIDIEVYLGDNFTTSFAFTLNGSPVVLTGRTYMAQIREAPGATATLATFTVDASQFGTGIVTLTLDNATTAALVTTKLAGGALQHNVYWDLQQTAGGVVTTVVAGRCNLIRDTTR